MARINPNVSRFHYLNSEELGPILDDAMADTRDESRNSWVALFRNRALDRIRQGSSDELLNEARILSDRLYSPAGQKLRREHPGYFARLDTIAEMLKTAGERTDTAFVQAVLASHKKYANRILEMLARATGGVPRTEIRDELRTIESKLSESHLTHILADLDNAGVITRVRRPKTKEVRITLDAAGRDLVEKQLRPEWFVKSTQLVRHVARGGDAPSEGQVTELLRKANAPSELVVTLVQELLATLTDTASAFERRTG